MFVGDDPQKSEADRARARERNRAWRAANPGYAREWAKKNPDKVRANWKKQEAKRRGARRVYYARVWEENKESEKARWRKQKYGVTPEQFSSMRSLQKDCCAICNSRFADEAKIQIDHCHATGLVRGLLCGNCNRGLGSFGDNIESLKEAINYLHRTHPLPLGERTWWTSNR